MISRRLEAVKPSATMAMTARATQLRREGRDIVSLSVGEPDFPIFPHVEQAVTDALRKGYTKYTAPNGLLELREAISAGALAAYAASFREQRRGLRETA